MKCSQLLKRMILICSFLPLTVFAAGAWKAAEFTDGDFKLPYQLYEPERSGNEALPLVISLHGSGEAGTDNTAQLYAGQNIGPDYFASNTIQSIQKAFVLAPQTPGPIRWANTNLGEYDMDTTPPTVSMAALLKLLDQLKTNPAIDPKRIYMTGLSRGGQGVWYSALLRPNDFAAIVPMAGAGSPKHAGRIATLPIWAFHGNADTTTTVAVTRNMVNALRAAGATDATLKYTEIEGGEHSSSWLTAHKNSELWQWMLKWQKK